MNTGMWTLTSDECEAAMCLWEECLLRQVLHKQEHGRDEEDPLFLWLAEGEGTASARDKCMDLAVDIEGSYQIARDEFGFDDCFDWEFVPRWADEAMELTEYQYITKNWWSYLAYKVTERWKYETNRSFNSEDA